MAKDAMDEWRKDLEPVSEGPPASPLASPPPEPPPEPDWFSILFRRPETRRRVKFELEASIALAIGIVGTTLLVFALGWREGWSPLYLFVPILAAAVAQLRHKSNSEVALAALFAGLSGFGVAVVLLPLLFFLDFLDCWLSWLSDC